MKVAIVGSREITKINDIGSFLPHDCEEIITGGARGVDSCVAEYARQKGIKLTVIFPQYDRYGRGAPRGTLSVINYCKKTGKRCEIIYINK